MTPPSPLSPSAPWSNSSPSKRPERVTLKGRWITLAPLDAEKHADALFEGANGGDKDRVWTYLFDGPYTDPAAFKASIAAKAQSADPLFFAILDNASGAAVGYQTFLRIDPPNRVIEVGNILYTPRDAAHGGRDRSAISLRALCLRRSRLSPL